MIPKNSSNYPFINKQTRFSVIGEIPYGDDIESAKEVGLVRAGRLRRAVLMSAFEGRLA